MGFNYPQGFSPQQGLDFAINFCQQAYYQDYIFRGEKQANGQPYVFTEPEHYEMMYEIWGIDEIWHDDQGTVPFGFVARERKTNNLVFAIRGTEGDIEWAEDLFEADQIASPVANSKGLVHKGFGNIYETLTYQAATSNSLTPPAIGSGDKLGQVVSSASAVSITGHSLGSALATLLALDVALNTKTPITQFYTFASPRTGDPDFVTQYNGLVPANSYRVANVWDIVPHTPPEILFTIDHEWHYQHVNSYCPVDGGETIDVVTSHGLAAYEAGLRKLL